MSSTPPSQHPPTTPEGIEQETKRLLGKQGPFRPSVRLIRRNGVKWVAKDYRACTPLYRWTVGRWNLAREEKALRRLEGVPGVPTFVGRVGHWILLMSFFPGPDVGRSPKEHQDAEFFRALAETIRQVHARGVVHLDLRQRRNVLVMPDGQPAVIDFGASLCLRAGSWLHRRLAAIDDSGVLKYKHRADPQLLSDDERERLSRADRRRRLWPFG